MRPSMDSKTGKARKPPFLFPFFGCVAKKGQFPTGRKTACCPYKVRSGEPVVVVHPKAGSSEPGTIVLHARCLAEVLATMPPDPKDVQSQYDRIRSTLHKEYT